MSKSSLDFTDSGISKFNLNPQIGKRIFDPQGNGLYFRKQTATGKITWAIRYIDEHGSQKNKNIGTWSNHPQRNKESEMTVGEARLRVAGTLDGLRTKNDSPQKITLLELKDREAKRKAQDEQAERDRMAAEEKVASMPALWEFVAAPDPQNPQDSFWEIRNREIREDIKPLRKNFEREFGKWKNLKLDEITPQLISDYIYKNLKSEKNPTGRSWKTLQHYCGTLSSVMNRAVDAKKIERNPYLDRSIKKPKHKKDGEKVTLISLENQQMIFAQLRIRDAEKREASLLAYERLKESGAWTRKATKAAKRGRQPKLIWPLPEHYVDYLEPWLFVCKNTGMRNIEILRLKWKMVKLDSEYPELNLTASITKTGEKRSVPLNDEAYEVLKKWHSQQVKAGYAKQDDYVFPSTAAGFEGTQMKKIGNAYARLRQDAGVSMSETNAYRFRHTMITDMIHSGGNIKEVADIAGNSPIMVQDVYLNSGSKESARNLMQKVSQYRSENA